MKVVNTNIPVIFQKIQEVDDRFMRVKIWLMHLGENYNGSSFEKENVIKAIPTLANTPILGFIESNGNEEDYSDHRIILTRKNGKFEEKYIGQAYGTIPEDNNAQFELRVGDDGVEREYLTCEGLLWQKWDIPTEIMDRDLVKSQSMELHKDFKGYWNDDTQLFHFTDFKFFGACILGSNVMPGMNSASIEKEFSFSQESFQLQIQEKMEELKIAFSRYQESLVDDTNKSSKEDKNMNEKLLELLSKYGLSDKGIEAQIVIGDFTSEIDLEAKVFSIALEVATTEKGLEVTNQFTDKITSLTSELDTVKGDFESLKADFDTLKNEKDQVDGDFQTLNEEVSELRSFKETKVAEERVNAENAIFESFSEQLSKEDIESVKSESSQFTLEEIEFKLFALVGKKNFSKKEKTKEVNKIIVHKDEQEDDNYGGILSNFAKS
jgi:hypothetical protein